MKLVIKPMFICLIITLLSCNKHPDNFVADTIQIDIKVQSLKKVNINDIFSKIEFVPLETSEKSIVGNYKDFKVFKGKYYIRDSQQNCVFVFDNAGKMVFTSKKFKGKGPEDYYNCGHFTIDRKTGNILILDMPLRKINEYQLNGEFVSSVYFPKEFVGIQAFEALSKNLFAFYFSENTPGMDESIAIFDAKKNRIISKIAPFPEKYLHVSTNKIPFYYINDTLIFNHMFPSLTTYLISPNNYKLQEKYKYDFGKFNFDPNILQQNVDKKNHKVLINDYFNRYAIVFNKIENDNYLLISFFLEHSYIAFYKKDSDELFIKENFSGSSKQLLSPDAIDDNYVYSLCPPENVKYVISEQLLDQNNRNKLNKMKITDNVVIVKYKFKES